MRKLALTIAATLVLAVVAPAFSQPFADVPTDHWAFDAIAELAAKGIVEGYPDGTFKGDRAMTRYEIAMVVARILARIEAIKIPAPAPPPKIPAPEVGRADIAALQRLVNEFRAELAALGVRVTAVEEELAALKARTDNVRVTGNVRFRYSTSTLPGGAPSAVYRNRTQLTGTVSRNVTAVMRFTTDGAAAAGSSQFTFSSQGTFGAVVFDRAYLDLNGIYGFNWRLGRQDYTLAGQGYSGYGLLYDPAAVAISGIGMTDGLVARGSIAGFSLEGGAFRETTTGLTVFTGRARAALIPGWTFTFSGMSQRRDFTAAAFPNTNDTGWGVDASGTVLPGMTLGAAYARFSPAAAIGAASTAWTAWSAIDLGRFSGLGAIAPTLTVWYKNYGTQGAVVTAPAHTGATTEVFQANPFNFRGWGLAFDGRFSPSLTYTLTYESGNVNSTGATVVEWFAVVGYSLAPGTTLSFRYFRATTAGVDTSNFYRIQLDASY